MARLRRWLWSRLWHRSLVAAPLLALRYRQRFGHWPNPLAPRTFNQKLFVRMAFDRRAWLPLLAGKVEGRAYAIERLGTDRLLPRLLATVTDPSQLERLALPERYIMKASHASGLNRVVGPETPITAGETARLVGEWLAVDYGRWSQEWVYKHLARAVVFEELMQHEGQVPKDLKFYCFGGEPRFVHVVSDRFGSINRAMLDMDWRDLHVNMRYTIIDAPTPERPQTFAQMIEVARTLAAGLDFVRVDLYDLGDELRVGELTLYPDGGSGLFRPPGADLMFGELWPMPSWRTLRGG